MIKDSRKIETFTGLKVAGKRINTPQAAARFFAWGMAIRVGSRWATRHGTTVDWARRQKMYARMTKRLLPHLKWIMQRK